MGNVSHCDNKDRYDKVVERRAIFAVRNSCDSSDLMGKPSFSAENPDLF